MSATMVQQRSFDDLGTPLHAVTFCVVDLETTGGSPETCRITEVGALRLRGGECLGTFETLVNPGVPIPPSITYLTGITETMVLPAPRIEEVLPAFLEFARGAVLVGHNLRFDVSFLDAALVAAGYPRLGHRTVDTCGLARRLVRDEVPNCRLGTLATHLRLPHRPTHRAFDDAAATADLFHLLLERAAGLGVLGLDDLVGLPKMGAHPQAGKLKLTVGLPRSPGVYVFRDARGRPLYVGKAANLRARVRSYFSSDDRRKIGPMLRETAGLDHVVCHHGLEAAVVERRLIRSLSPRYNRQGRRPADTFLKFTLNEPFPRLSVARSMAGDGALFLGPLPTPRLTRLAIEAIESVIPIRRCATRLRLARAGRVDDSDDRDRARAVRVAPCAPAQLGVSTCPCAGTVGAGEYRALVELTIEALTESPELVLGPLRRRIDGLARAERYEQAADVRDRAEALTTVLRRQRRLSQLTDAGLLRLLVPGGGAEIDGGILVRSWGNPSRSRMSGTAPRLPIDLLPAPPDRPSDLADEALLVAGWLDANAHRVRLLDASGPLVSPAVPLPSFAPRGRVRE
jgi:DNA polymerase-3 subunit epsilon